MKHFSDRIIIELITNQCTNMLWVYVNACNIIPSLILGNSDPPSELRIFLKCSLLMTAWDYRIIPTVSVKFTISLTFLSPSQLEDVAEYVTDTDSYNFTLEGVRSCDPLYHVYHNYEYKVHLHVWTRLYLTYLLQVILNIHYLERGTPTY